MYFAMVRQIIKHALICCLGRIVCSILCLYMVFCMDLRICFIISIFAVVKIRKSVYEQFC